MKVNQNRSLSRKFSQETLHYLAQKGYRKVHEKMMPIYGGKRNAVQPKIGHQSRRKSYTDCRRGFRKVQRTSRDLVLPKTTALSRLCQQRKGVQLVLMPSLRVLGPSDFSLHFLFFQSCRHPALGCLYTPDGPPRPLYMVSLFANVLHILLFGTFHIIVLVLYAMAWLRVDMGQAQFQLQLNATRWRVNLMFYY